MQATSCPAVSSPVGRSSDPAAFRLSAERVSAVRKIGKLECARAGYLRGLVYFSSQRKR